MPVDSSSILSNISWQHYRQNSGFLDTNQGPDSLSASVESETAEDIYAESKILGLSSTRSYDLTALTDLLLQPLVFTNVLALMVTVSSGSVTMTPGGSNPATRFMGGTSPGIVIPEDGAVICSTNTVVDSTHKNLTIATGASSGATYQIAILGGA